MRIEFDDLYSANLILNAVYVGGSKGNVSDDVISKLMGCENSGGFRKVGKSKEFDLKYVALYSTLQDEYWKDEIDEQNRIFIYHGDNIKPGKDLLDTRKKGNLILRDTYEAVQKGQRDKIPPFFIFIKEERRNVIFKGIAVPKMGDKEYLKIVEYNVENNKIKNYEAYFDILPTQSVDRRWLDDLKMGLGYNSQYAPEDWKYWIETGKIRNYTYSNEEFVIENAILNEGNNQYRKVDEIEIEYIEKLKKSQVDTKENRLKRIKQANKFPTQIKAVTTVYKRNPDIVAEVLERAQGICEVCGKSAPFIRISDGTPYLEVHHKKRLADGGEDTIENTIAVCPNCHRELHYGI